MEEKLIKGSTDLAQAKDKIKKMQIDLDNINNNFTELETANNTLQKQN